jgi:methionine synthase II (cobalamin-independent)
MPMPEGWGTLGPFRLPEKLKKAFKELYKGKVEERMVEMIQTDIEKKVPDWNKEKTL